MRTQLHRVESHRVGRALDRFEESSDQTLRIVVRIPHDVGQIRNEDHACCSFQRSSYSRNPRSSLMSPKLSAMSTIRHSSLPPFLGPRSPRPAIWIYAFG